MGHVSAGDNLPTMREVARVDAPSLIAFRLRYVMTSTPVIVRGLVTGDMGRFAPEALAARARAQGVAGVPLSAIVTRGGGFAVDARTGVAATTTTLEAQAARLAAGGRGDGVGDAGVYLSATLGELPEVVRGELALPEYAARSWFVRRKFWVSAAGTVSPLHFDVAHNLHTQLFGVKRFVLFRWGDRRYLEPHGLFSSTPNFSAVDLRNPTVAQRAALMKTTPYVAELMPGETLFMPSRMWHHVETVEASVTVNTWFAAGLNVVTAVAAETFKRLRGVSR